MKNGTLLNNLRLNKIRNIVIYASFIILVFSLIFEMRTDNFLVTRVSLIFLIYGLYLWLLEYIEASLEALAENDQNAQILVVVAWVVFSVLGFFKAFKIAFNVSLLDVIRG